MIHLLDKTIMTSLKLIFQTTSVEGVSFTENWNNVVPAHKKESKSLTHLFLMHPFSTLENLAIFLCFQGVEKRYIGNKWVNKELPLNKSTSHFQQNFQKAYFSFNFSLFFRGEFTHKMPIWIFTKRFIHVSVFINNP